MSGHPPTSSGTTTIPGCRVLDVPVHRDARGWFAKPYHATQFTAMGLPQDWAECFVSQSARGIVRGFHVQLPPSAHSKLIWVAAGASRSAFLDLRVGSPTFGQAEVIDLDAPSGVALFVPIGVAHAFQALLDDTILVYLVTSVHDPACDAGVRWDSTMVKWPIPITAMSVRDEQLPPLASFQSPFRFQP